VVDRTQPAFALCAAASMLLPRMAVSEESLTRTLRKPGGTIRGYGLRPMPQ
jgi:hypothetical protein